MSHLYRNGYCHQVQQPHKRDQGVILVVMIDYPPIAIIYMGSYCSINMIHATYIWVLMIFIVGVFIESENRSETEKDASTLYSIPKCTF
jgi:hypothetical protein